jgi:hypothetical protein
MNGRESQGFRLFFKQEAAFLKKSGAKNFGYAGPGAWRRHSTKTTIRLLALYPIRLAPSAFAGIHVFFETATASQITYNRWP